MRLRGFSCRILSEVGALNGRISEVSAYVPAMVMLLKVSPGSLAVRVRSLKGAAVVGSVVVFSSTVRLSVSCFTQMADICKKHGKRVANHAVNAAQTAALGARKGSVKRVGGLSGFVWRLRRAWAGMGVV